MPQFLALTTRGLFDVLADELSALKVKEVTKTPEGVFFEGSWQDCYRVNYMSRIATRVVLPLGDFDAMTEQQLYDAVRGYDFSKWIHPDQTIFVDAKVRECGDLRDQRFVTMKIKDAIVDRFRDKFGERPNVEKELPDLSILVRGFKGQFKVYLDTSGVPLFKRGYREQSTDTHLKEHLAASLVKMAWNGRVPLVDPMCGSGTVVIEAALWRSGVPPGDFRRYFAFQRLKNFDKEQWRKTRAEFAQPSEFGDEPVPEIIGYDVDRRTSQVAKHNVEDAGVSDLVQIHRHDFETLKLPETKGVIIVDPPYGERQGEINELVETYKNLAHWFKHEAKGWTAWVLSGNPELTRELKLKTSRKIPIMNGPIECRFLRYELF